MASSPVLVCPKCARRYQLRPGSTGQGASCKTCRVPLVVSATEGPDEGPATAGASPLVPVVRQALSQLSEAVPGHGLGDLGAEAAQLRARAGRIYTIRVAVLSEERSVAWVWQTPEGRTVPADMAKTLPSPIPELPPEPTAPKVPSQPSVCPDCKGKEQVLCYKCRGTQRVPCKDCDVTGRRKCYMCDGTGDVMVIHGSGANVRRACRRCLGRKVIACDDCGGTGHAVCAACPSKGQYVGGYVMCRTCLGRGIVQPESTPIHPARVQRDPWQVLRPEPTEFAALSETSAFEATASAALRCPECKGRSGTCKTCRNQGRAACARCAGEGREFCEGCGGLGCSDCDDGFLGTCPACNGKKVVTCTECGGDGPKPCQTCGGDGRIRTALVMRRVIEPFERELFVGEIRCPAEAFRGWDLSESFNAIPPDECLVKWEPTSAADTSLGRSRSLGCQGAKVPEVVREAIASIARELPAIGGARRLARLPSIKIGRAEAIYARYVSRGKSSNAGCSAPISACMPRTTRSRGL